jgi:hypothetical protein
LLRCPPLRQRGDRCGERPAHHEDEDVSENIKTILEGEGIKIVWALNASALKHGDQVAVQVDCSSGDKIVIGSHARVGRVPNTNDLRKTPGLNPISAVTSRLMINFVPMCPAYMRCAIATDEEPSLIPHNDYEIVAANLLDLATSAAWRPDHCLRPLH